jgi:magnesium transporter
MVIYDSLQKQTNSIQSFSIPNEHQVIWFQAANDDKEKIFGKLSIHPLAKKHFSTFSSIPKVSVFKNEAVLCLTALNNRYEPEKINILVGKNYVITLEEKSRSDLFQPLSGFFLEHPEQMAHTGQILFHLINRITSNYLSFIDDVADEILQLEKKVFIDPFENQIGRKAYRWKTRLHELRQIIEPQESVIKEIVRKKFPYTNDESNYYFQDIENDYSRVISALDTFKENLMAIYNLQMSLKADHTNAIMKTLTLVSVIFIPMTFLAGLYGMNFEYMPELKWRYGYFLALFVMFAIGIAIAWIFRIKGWWGQKNETK